MSWQIDLFRVRPAQDPKKVRDVQYDWETHRGYRIEEPSDESDRWLARVLARLHEFADDFEEVEAPTTTTMATSST